MTSDMMMMMMMTACYVPVSFVSLPSGQKILHRFFHCIVIDSKVLLLNCCVLLTASDACYVAL